MYKESVCNAEELDSIPGLGRSPGEGREGNTQCNILAWRISGTEESGELQSIGLQGWTRLSD